MGECERSGRRVRRGFFGRRRPSARASGAAGERERVIFGAGGGGSREGGVEVSVATSGGQR